MDGLGWPSLRWRRSWVSLGQGTGGRSGQGARITILALGKLGAGDLIFIPTSTLFFFRGERDEEGAVNRLARSVVGDLDAPGGERIYRVDLRLRPEGDRGALCSRAQ